MEEFGVNFLDLDPIITALKTRPTDFEMDGKWLHHFPSRHRFRVDAKGNVRLDTLCDCALLHSRREQGQALWDAFQIWHSAYWRPIEINEKFAREFRAPNIWQRFYRRLRAKVRRSLRQVRAQPSASGVVVAADREEVRGRRHAESRCSPSIV
jgi:hypothetical protein